MSNQLRVELRYSLKKRRDEVLTGKNFVLLSLILITLAALSFCHPDRNWLDVTVLTVNAISLKIIIISWFYSRKCCMVLSALLLITTFASRL